MFWEGFLVSLFVAILAYRLLQPILSRLGIYDVPNQRSVHKTQVLKMGGLIFIAGHYVGILYILYHQNFSLTTPSFQTLIGILGGSITIVLLGALDDMVDLSPSTKFVVESFIATSVCLVAKIGIHTLSFPGFSLDLGIISIPFTVFWIVGVINAINFMDGLDGLAGGLCLILLSGLFLLPSDNLAALVFIPCLCGGLLVFLNRNFHPATLYMGDVGSLFLGYHLAILTLILLPFDNPSIGAFAPCLLLGLPLLDTAITIVRRLVKRQSVFGADRKHIHHLLLDAGLSHRRSVHFLYLITLILTALVVIATRLESSFNPIILGSGFCLLLALTVMVLALRPKQKKQES
jgi:UDP-GlcNAc:undecaprenyl-phosphate/decaprenyl-phosphate GlcNAc-1-phosphate transferase